MSNFDQSNQFLLKLKGCVFLGVSTLPLVTFHVTNNMKLD